MRTCDCGWIADWDLGDSCTLYMLGSAIRMWAGSGEPPPPGTRRFEDEGSSAGSWGLRLAPSDDTIISEARPGRAACAVSILIP